MSESGNQSRGRTRLFVEDCDTGDVTDIAAWERSDPGVVVLSAMVGDVNARDEQPWPFVMFDEVIDLVDDLVGDPERAREVCEENFTDSDNVRMLKELRAAMVTMRDREQNNFEVGREENFMVQRVYNSDADRAKLVVDEDAEDWWV